MKVSGCVIQTRNIKENTSDVFLAYYKGKEINITSDHGHGKPEMDHLTRFDITVTDLESGMLDVNTYEDCHYIKDAIRKALKGAMLI